MNYDLRNAARTWVLPFVLVAAILIGINLLWLIPALQNIRGAASVLALEIADRLRADTNFFLSTTLAELSFAAEDIAHEPERAKLTIQLLMKRQPGFRNVVLLDRTANEIIQIDRYELVGNTKIRDYSKHGYFYLALEGASNFGTLQVSPELEPFITLAVPVQRAGRVENILVADLSLRSLITAVSHIRPEQGVAYILDKDGFQIVHPDLTEILKRQNFLSRQIAQKTLIDGEIADGLAAEDFYVNDRGVETFTVGVPIPIAQLGLFYEQPRSQAFAGERQAILIAVATILLGIFVFIFFIRNNVRLTALNAKLGDLLRELDSVGKMLVRRDIELMRANVRLEALDQAKSEFVSVAAHQLRTPLTGIKWTLSTLLEEVSQFTVEQKKIISDAFSAAGHLTELINDLLDVARIEEGRFGFKLKTQFIAPLFKEMSEAFARVIREKGISYHQDIPSRLPALSFDYDKLGIALANLLDNSIKYTPPGGKISFKVSAEPNRLLISITDSGIGIPKEQSYRIFGKFFRSANAQLYHTGGTGLGLYVVKSIVNRHGGTIWFDSVEDKGTTFYVSLPLAEVNQRPLEK